MAGLGRREGLLTYRGGDRLTRVFAGFCVRIQGLTCCRAGLIRAMELGYPYPLI